jgi:hypothetical protein
MKSSPNYNLKQFYSICVESTIYHTWGEHVNNYLADVVEKIKKMYVKCYKNLIWPLAMWSYYVSGHYSRVHKILHMGLVVLVKKMSVLINFLLQNSNLASVLSKICPNFAGHVWQDWQISWTLLSLSTFTYTRYHCP